MYNLILSFEKRLKSIIDMVAYKQGVILLICSVPLLIFTNPAFLYRFFECIKAISNGSEYVYFEIIEKQSENIFSKLNEFLIKEFDDFGYEIPTNNDSRNNHEEIIEK